MAATPDLFAAVDQAELKRQSERVSRALQRMNKPPQWYSSKTTGEKLNLVFQNIADEDGKVEGWQFIGGRDFVVFWSKPVQR